MEVFSEFHQLTAKITFQKRLGLVKAAHIGCFELCLGVVLEIHHIFSKFVYCPLSYLADEVFLTHV